MRRKCSDFREARCVKRFPGEEAGGRWRTTVDGYVVYLVFDRGKVAAINSSVLVSGQDPTNEQMSKIRAWFGVPRDYLLNKAPVSFSVNPDSFAISVWESSLFSREKRREEAEAKRVEAELAREEAALAKAAAREAKQEEIRGAFDVLFKQSGVHAVAAIDENDLIIITDDECDRTMLLQLQRAMASLELDPSKQFDSFRCTGTSGGGAMVRYRPR